ncbi:hypothetical protein F4558_003659 [Micromonospora profundi]|nr:hypothetical protein [Micromonospora profundi]
MFALFALLQPTQQPRIVTAVGGDSSVARASQRRLVQTWSAGATESVDQTTATVKQ